MRMFLYVCILALLPLAPVKRLDVAKLQPVQTVAVKIRGETVTLETDTGSVGQGRTIGDAVASLEENTPGVIYLDTAEFLLLGAGAEKEVASLQKYMGAGVRVSAWDGKGDVKTAAQYLQVRKDLPRLDSFLQKE